MNSLNSLISLNYLNTLKPTASPHIMRLTIKRLTEALKKYRRVKIVLYDSITSFTTATADAHNIMDVVGAGYLHG